MRTVKKLQPEPGTGYFEGQLLIATPSLTGSCFSRSVIYMCQHNEEGAMGLIINQKLETLDAKKIFEQFSIQLPKSKRAFPVFFGGPVDMVRGFVLHTADYSNKDTFPINEELALTSSTEILQDIVDGKGPKKSLLALGYSGWGAMQLEKEIEENSWFTVPPSLDLIFDSENESKWQRAADSVGVDLLKFSSNAGHA
jgi:putative transcriptional regulator